MKKKESLIEPIPVPMHESKEAFTEMIRSYEETKDVGGKIFVDVITP